MTPCSLVTGTAVFETSGAAILQLSAKLHGISSQYSVFLMPSTVSARYLVKFSRYQPSAAKLMKTELFWVITWRRKPWITSLETSVVNYHCPETSVGNYHCLKTPVRTYNCPETSVRAYNCPETTVRNYQSLNVGKEWSLSRNVGKDLPLSRNVRKELPLSRNVRKVLPLSRKIGK